MGKRLINADELLQMIRERKKRWQTDRANNTGAWQRVNEDVCIATMVETLADRGTTAPEWIPVEKALPDTPRTVLATVRWSDDDREVIQTEYWEKYGWSDNKEIDNRVTAWMELPEAYKEAGR